MFKHYWSDLGVMLRQPVFYLMIAAIALGHLPWWPNTILIALAFTAVMPLVGRMFYVSNLRVIDGHRERLRSSR